MNKAFVAVIAALTVSACDPREDEQPNTQAMLAHLASRYSDEQLREAMAEAETRYAVYMEQFEARVRTRAEQSAAQSAACRDSIYEVRNPEKCRPTITYSETPNYSSARDFFEQSLLGMCNYTQTVREARSKGCLPKN